MPTQDHKIALVTGALAAVVVSGVIVFGSSHGTPTPVPPAVQQLVADHPTDLLSAPVEPGAEVATVSDLRRGWTFNYQIALTGNAIGRFDVLGVKTVPRGDGGTHLEVYARNVSDRTIRFSAAIGYSVTPDAGVP